MNTPTQPAFLIIFVIWLFFQTVFTPFSHRRLLSVSRHSTVIGSHRFFFLKWIVSFLLWMIQIFKMLSQVVFNMFSNWKSHLNVRCCCRFGNYKATLNYIKGFTFADWLQQGKEELSSSEWTPSNCPDPRSDIQNIQL